MLVTSEFRRKPSGEQCQQELISIVSAQYKISFNEPTLTNGLSVVI